ncbi:hypothetical protein C3L33_15885, partial [Rhododendron williamsianum]
MIIPGDGPGFMNAATKGTLQEEKPVSRFKIGIQEGNPGKEDFCTITAIPQSVDPNTHFDCPFSKTAKIRSGGMGIPSMITWSFDGKQVAIEGSWDNWRTRDFLQKSGKDFTINEGAPIRCFTITSLSLMDNGEDPVLYLSVLSVFLLAKGDLFASELVQ